MNEFEAALIEDYYEKNVLECIPLHIYPPRLLTFTRIKVIQGVTIRKILPGEIDKVKSAFYFHEFSRKIYFTHLVCIDRPDYLQGVKKRIHGAEQKLPEIFHIEKEAIVKQVLLSLFLTSSIMFEVDAGGSIKIEKKGRNRKYRGAGWSKGWFYSVPSIYQGAVVGCGVGEKAINPKIVREYACLLDPYLRSGIWWQDRMAAALAHLLDALCSQSMTLGFLSLMSSLEALVNTSGTDITYQIGERIAILCGKTKDERMYYFERVKKLYTTRSIIVHGQATQIKGKVITWDSLLVSPKFSVVPFEELKDLFRITILSIRSVLRDKELVQIYKSSRDEKKIRKRIVTYFVSRVL